MRYYHVGRDGRRIYHGTLDAATDAAARLATALQRRVIVGYEPTPAPKARTIKAKANPDAGDYVDMAWRKMQAQQTAAQVRKDRGERRKARQLAPPKGAAAVATRAAKQAPGKQGAAARRRGMPESFNPYKAGSMGHALWRDGWKKGR